MYFIRVTENARTRGARFVIRVVDARSSSPIVVIGRVSDVSRDSGVVSEPIRVDGLDRLAGDAVVGSPEDRFLVTRFAAARTALACFSSGKMDWILVRDVFASVSGLIYGSVYPRICAGNSNNTLSVEISAGLSPCSKLRVEVLLRLE